MSMSRLLHLASVTFMAFAMGSAPMFDVASAATTVPRKEWCLWSTSPWYESYEDCKWYYDDWDDPKLYKCFTNTFKGERDNFEPVKYAIQGCKKITDTEAKKDDDINKDIFNGDCLRRAVQNGPCYQEYPFLHGPSKDDDISEEILGAKVKKGTGSKRCEKAKRAWKACKKEDGDPFECFYKEYKDDKVYGKMSDLCLGSFPSANKKDRKFICFLLAIAKGACHADAGFLDSENLG